MLPLEHSAILLTCIKRYGIQNQFLGVIFEWPLKTGFTVPIVLWVSGLQMVNVIIASLQ